MNYDTPLTNDIAKLEDLPKMTVHAEQLEKSLRRQDGVVQATREFVTRAHGYNVRTSCQCDICKALVILDTPA